MARDGLLMSYGFDTRASWRRAASHVDRIFKGANPAELPVEQLDRFQFIITTGRPRGPSASICRQRWSPAWVTDLNDPPAVVWAFHNGVLPRLRNISRAEGEFK